jgi:hypothetical protein
MANKAQLKRIESYLEVISLLEEPDGSVMQTASLLNEGDAEVEVIDEQ